MKEIKIGKGRVVIENEGADIAVLTIGPALHEARKAIEQLESEGVKANLYDMIWVKPLDSELLRRVADNHKAIVTVEDGVVTGGFGSAVTEWCRARHLSLSVKTLGAPDSWVAHGTVAELKNDCGYDCEGIKAAVRSAAAD